MPSCVARTTLPSASSTGLRLVQHTLSAVRASLVRPAGVALGTLFDVLGEQGVHELWVLGNSIGDRYLFDPVPDMVIGVLNPQPEATGQERPDGLSNLDVMLRMGRAAERGIPALVIVPPPLAVPSSTDGIAFAACPVDHHSALSTHLWAFTTAIISRQGHPSQEPHPEGRHVGVARLLSDILQKTPASIAEEHFEGLVSAVLRDAGAASVEAQSAGAGGRVDIVLAPSEDSPSVVLVETKSGNLNEPQLREAEQRLLRYVKGRQAAAGLLIYHDTFGTQFPANRATPLIARLSIEELLDQLSTRSLSKVISDATAVAMDPK